MTELSVVMITRNQVWNVDRLVGSVLRELEGGPAAEVLLVDSASDDGTPERAARHPIGVLRLGDEGPLTAALGRALGARETSGELVLFLDGDMELCPGWLGRALRIMRERPDVAAVAGTVVDVPVHTPGKSAHWPDEVLAAADGDREPWEITNTGGAALHRRGVLEAVGSFNAALRSEEEPELCLRIRGAGHRVLHIGTPIALHYSTPARTIATLLARRRRRLYEGMGQVARLHLGSPLGVVYLRERGFGLAPGAALLVGAGALATGVGARRWWPFALWASLLTSTVGVHAARRRSLHDALFSLVQRGCIVEGMVRGALSGASSAPAAAPAFEVVRAIPGAP